MDLLNEARSRVLLQHHLPTHQVPSPRPPLDLTAVVVVQLRVAHPHDRRRAQRLSALRAHRALVHFDAVLSRVRNDVLVLRLTPHPLPHIQVIRHDQIVLHPRVVHRLRQRGRRLLNEREQLLHRRVLRVLVQHLLRHQVRVVAVQNLERRGEVLLLQLRWRGLRRVEESIDDQEQPNMQVEEMEINLLVLRLFLLHYFATVLQRLVDRLLLEQKDGERLHVAVHPRVEDLGMMGGVKGVRSAPPTARPP